MKNKKVLLYYLLELILAICIFLIIILSILKLTILNKNYIINILEKNNYYHELYLDINNDFDNYILQSGFDNSITKDLFNENDLKKVINNNVDNYYQGKDIKVDSSKLQEKLEDNIDNYLNKINIKITDEESLNLFKQEIINIYTKKIIIHESISNTKDIFVRINNYSDILFIGLLSISILLFIIIKKCFKKITLTIPILSSCLLLLIIYIYLNNHINVNSILIWNIYLSNIIKNIINDIFTYFKYISIVGIIIEIIKLIVIMIKMKKK